VPAASSRCSPARHNRRPGTPAGLPRAADVAALLLPREFRMADDTSTTPLFQIQRMYLKDLSLEQPNSPQILLEQGSPQVEINLTLGAETIGDAMFEVTVMATVTTKINDKTLFLVEAKQGGIFEIRNIPDEQVRQILGIACPNIVYPYLRAIVSDVCTRAGFPPVVLTEVNFQAMYEAQQAQAQAQAAAVTNGSGATGTIN
jgi:preprotein translocase subunit SecB